MNKRNRAWRRAQKQLNKSRRVKLCSCYMCGNPRKFFGELTMQERKQNERDNTIHYNEDFCIQDDWLYDPDPTDNLWYCEIWEWYLKNKPR